MIYQELILKVMVLFLCVKYQRFIEKGYQVSHIDQKHEIVVAGDTIPYVL